MKKFINSFLSLVGAIILALLIRTIVFEPYSIPSGSMKPNFIVGDYLFVSKFTYGIGNASFPLSPNIFKNRILEFKKPERGDVVVFKTPDDRYTNYIKRLIGLPGDRVQVRSGILYLNGMEAKREAAGEFIDTDGKILLKYKETLPSGKSYFILEDPSIFNPLDNTIEFIVPKGHYFFIGDNRDHSGDSRTMGRPIGYIPESEIIGKAEIIIFSNTKPLIDILHWPLNFNLNRFFIKVN